MSDAEAKQARKAALDQLRNRQRASQAGSDATEGSQSSLPSQMRDATKPLVSRHFSSAPARGAPSSSAASRTPRVFVPNSSPIAPAKPPGVYTPKMGHHPPTNGKKPPAPMFKGKMMQQEILRVALPRDTLSPSATASSSRSSSVRRARDEGDEGTDHPPRKKQNVGSGSGVTSPIDIPSSPSSVSAVKTGVKVMHIDSSVTNIDSSPSPRKPRGRLVRGRRASAASSDSNSSLSPPLPSPSTLYAKRKITIPTPVDRIAQSYPDIAVAEIERLWEQEDHDASKVLSILTARSVKSAAAPVIDLSGDSPAPPRTRTNGISREMVDRRPQPTQSKPRVRDVVDIDDDEDFSDSDDDESDDEGRAERTALALVWFNEATAEQLVEVTACSAVQAQIIIAARPYESDEQLRNKLNRRKGISPRFFDDYIAILEGYDSVDKVIEKCELVGTQISDILAIWASAAGEILEAHEATDPGIDLVALPAADALPAPSYAAITEAEKAARDDALRDYIPVQPKSLAPGTLLKDYQLLGVNWLSLLHGKNLSCILADEMGLGKTVQVISFFAHLKEQGNKGPHLVIVPSSTLENWGREFEKFAPSLEVRTYYGTQNERIYQRSELVDEMGQWDVCITTYNLAQGNDQDRKFFKRIEWEACVFDEGHVLKNFQSQRYNQLLKIGSKWRLLLTGTPLQNNLQELVSLMNFILPKYFRDALESLRAIFKVRASSHTSLLSESRVSRASKMMTPFVLRRRKDQVLKDLPKKTERIEWCETTALQRTIYDEAMQRSRSAVEALPKDEKALLETVAELDEEATNGDGKGRGKGRPKKGVLMSSNSSGSNVLMELRKASCHPMLFRRLFDDAKINLIARHCLQEPDFHDSSYDLVVEDMQVMNDAELQRFCLQYKSVRKHALDNSCFLDAGKVTRLLPLLEQYKSENKRVLIFSQFTQIIDILKSIFTHLSIKHLVLTGQTPVSERQSLVDEFTEDESISVFLLSTKAGGMGINLTAACVVIIFDQDFNPHNDKQACDRAYRIGQKRDVEVVKLITRGTIEEWMLRLGQVKLDLDHAVAAGEGDESAPEKTMKASLLSVLRKQFEEEGETQNAARDAALKAGASVLETSMGGDRLLGEDTAMANS